MSFVVVSQGLLLVATFNKHASGKHNSLQKGAQSRWVHVLGNSPGVSSYASVDLNIVGMILTLLALPAMTNIS